MFTLGVAGELRCLWIMDVTIQERHQILHQPVMEYDAAYENCTWQLWPGHKDDFRGRSSTANHLTMPDKLDTAASNT